MHRRHQGLHRLRHRLRDLAGRGTHSHCRLLPLQADQAGGGSPVSGRACAVRPARSHIDPASRSRKPALRLGDRGPVSETTAPSRRPRLGLGDHGSVSETAAVSRRPRPCLGDHGSVSETTALSRRPRLCLGDRGSVSETTALSRRPRLCLGDHGSVSETTARFRRPRLCLGDHGSVSETTVRSRRQRLRLGDRRLRSVGRRGGEELDQPLETRLPVPGRSLRAECQFSEGVDQRVLRHSAASIR
jgi:hypothetical protein